MQLIAQVVACHRTYLGVFIQWVADLRAAHVRDKSVFKTWADGLNDHKPFRRDAALPGVDQSAGDTHRDRGIEVGIVQDHIGVAAAQF